MIDKTIKLLQPSEPRYRLMFDAAQNGIMILELESDKVLHATPFFNPLMGHACQEILGKKRLELGKH